MTAEWFRLAVREEQQQGHYYDARLWVPPTEEMFFRKTRRPQLKNMIKFGSVLIMPLGAGKWAVVEQEKDVAVATSEEIAVRFCFEPGVVDRWLEDQPHERQRRSQERRGRRYLRLEQEREETAALRRKFLARYGGSAIEKQIRETRATHDVTELSPEELSRLLAKWRAAAANQMWANDDGRSEAAIKDNYWSGGA